MLEQVGEEGRVRTYRSLVVAQQSCEPDACAPFIQSVLDTLNRVVMTAAEKHDAAGLDNSAPLPEIGIHELQLRAADVERIVIAFKAALPEPGEERAPSGDTYTVSFIVAPGGIRQHF